MDKLASLAVRPLQRLWVLSLVFGLACQPRAQRPTPRYPSRTRPTKANAAGQTTILSARVSGLDVREQGGLDEVTVVFSVELDAASLRPQQFLLFYADGRRAFPLEVGLAPASEADENRTVALRGELADASSDLPVDVMVVGSLYTEDGAKLRMLSAAIEAPTIPARAVFAVLAPTQERACAGLQQRVATYWSTALRDVDAADLAGIEVELADGRTVTPTRFDDHRLDRQHNEDNVLDLCIADATVVHRVKFAAELFSDPLGSPTAAVELVVAKPSQAK